MTSVLAIDCDFHARFSSQLVAARAVLLKYLPEEIAEERARNIVQALTLGDENLYAVARDALVGHWSLRAYALPADLPEQVARALGDQL